MKNYRECDTKGLGVWAVALVLVILLLSAPALYFGYRNHVWFVSDYFALFAPVAFWVSLTALGVGHQSLSHVVELVALVVLMPLLVSVRVFAAYYLPLPSELVSQGTVAIGIILAISLRLLTPYLPE